MKRYELRIVISGGQGPMTSWTPTTNDLTGKIMALTALQTKGFFSFGIYACDIQKDEKGSDCKLLADFIPDNRERLDSLRTTLDQAINVLNLLKRNEPTD